jgi:hypothetical protein
MLIFFNITLVKIQIIWLSKKWKLYSFMEGGSILKIKVVDSRHWLWHWQTHCSRGPTSFIRVASTENICTRVHEISSPWTTNIYSRPSSRLPPSFVGLERVTWPPAGSLLKPTRPCVKLARLMCSMTSATRLVAILMGFGHITLVTFLE